MQGPAALFWKRLSGVDQVETLFDALHALVYPVETTGNAGILVFEDAKPLLDLDHVLGHALDSSANGTKVLKNQVIGGHDTSVAREERHYRSE